MKINSYLAIDQGTTSTRAMVFSRNGEILITAQKEFSQIYPNLGWVEHDPEVIWKTTLKVLKLALKEADAKNLKVTAIGITNQRETTVIWDRQTGKAIYNAIVWQDRRTHTLCEQLKKDGHGSRIMDSTGLLIDPYFSATKIAWILDNVTGARHKAENGRLAFGTIDSFLLWRLTKGKVHSTDATNASRTSIFNIKHMHWDLELLEIFKVPESILPKVHDSSFHFGETEKDIVGQKIPILAILGDQQSAAVGQSCFDLGSLKSTYGTGGFLILNTGEKIVRSQSNLISTVLLQISGKPIYALEGSIFIAGAAVQWVRDQLGLIKKAEDSESHACKLDGNGGVYLVPAFTGLGAPHWDPNARGSLSGITRDTGASHVIRASLESVAYQTSDIVNCMIRDEVTPSIVKVDGGMSNNAWLMQFLSNILGIPVDVPVVKETTAMGVAMMAALYNGEFSNIHDIGKARMTEQHFSPIMGDKNRSDLIKGWERAVSSTLTNT